MSRKFITSDSKVAKNAEIKTVTIPRESEKIITSDTGSDNCSCSTNK